MSTLNKQQKKALEMAIEQKIAEAESIIRRQEDNELKEAEKNPSPEIKKLYKEYQKTINEIKKLEKRMKEITKQLEEKKWYVGTYNFKPILTMHYEHPVSRQIMTKAREKINELNALKNELKLQVAFLNANLDLVKYVKDIDEKIEKIIK